MVVECVDRVEPDVVAMRQHLDPVVAAGRRHRRDDELEVPRAVTVGDDEEPVTVLFVDVVLDAVLVLVLARGDQSGLAVGRVGRNEPRLRRELRG